MSSSGPRLAALALFAALAVAAPGQATGRAYAISRGASYATGSELLAPALVIPRGTELVFLNLHVWGHNITSDAWRTPSVRLFRSDVVPFRGEATVRGADALEPGTYGFFCSNHVSMRGSLTIV